MFIDSSTASVDTGYRKENIHEPKRGAVDDGQYSADRSAGKQVSLEDALAARRAEIKQAHRIETQRSSYDPDLYQREVSAMVMAGCC